MRPVLRTTALPLVFALCLTVVMTWPLTPRLASSGRLDTNDGRYAVWNVAWVARTLVVDPRGVFDANIFYPNKGTLAYSEANLVAGALAIPAYWASGGNPYLAHNSVVIMAFVLALLAAWALVKHLTGRSDAGLVAGTAYAFCPYVLSHLPHIQLLMHGGLPLALLAMHRYAERPSWGRGTALGLAVAFQALACGYYGVFAALLLVPGVIYYGIRLGHARSWRYWAGAAAAGALSIAIVLPFFLPFLEMRQASGFGRTLAETRQWSAQWSSWVASAAWAHRWLVPHLPPWGEVLYPGSIAVLLGIAGAVAAWRAPAVTRGRAHVWFYGCLGVFMVPALAVLAGFAVKWLLERVRRPALAGAILVAVTAADIVAAPLRLNEATPLPSAYESLKKWPWGPVAEFPFFYQRMDFPRHAEYMLFSTSHWRPLVNGYSDHIPAEFRQMVVPVSSFPNPESFNLLRPYRVRYVIFHLDLYSRAARAELEQRLEAYQKYLRPIRKEDPAWLFEIVAWPPPA